MVITGWQCLWWAGQWLCLQGGWAPVPCLTSRLPEDCDAHGIDIGPLENAVWGCCCPRGSHPLPEEGPGAQASPPPSSLQSLRPGCSLEETSFTLLAVTGEVWVGADSESTPLGATGVQHRSMRLSHLCLGPDSAMSSG